MVDELIETHAGDFKRRGFELIERIGRGASGAVFRAKQLSLGRFVAIKLFTQLVGRDDAMRKRFLREARILSALDHPNIPFVLTAGETADGTPFHAMQLVDGEKLTAAIERRRRIPWREAVEIATQLFAALSHASEHSVVHRDVAPDNILVTTNGRAMLVDFSIGFSTTEAPGLTRATETGQRLGRAAYASPEQRRDASKATHSSDVFSMAVVLFEILAGTPEIRFDSFDARLGPAPEELKKMLRLALSEDEGKRPPARELKLRLEALRSSASTSTQTSALSMCVNPSCPNAAQSENGFVLGPNVVETTSPFCHACGKQLVRQCMSCNVRLPPDTQDLVRRKRKGSPPVRLHCAECGELLYRAPSCAKCGSLLRLNELTRDTATDGCSKCPVPPPADDDLPF